MKGPLPILHSTFGEPHVHPDSMDYWKCVTICRVVPLVVVLLGVVAYFWATA